MAERRLTVFGAARPWNVIQFIIIIIIIDFSCHRLLSGASLEPAVIPTFQASSFTVQHLPYYVWCPSIAVFSSESIECFPGTDSKFFLKLLVTLPVAPIITDTIVHFRFHIRCNSVHKLSYYNLFSASFCITFLSAGVATSIGVHIFSFLFLIIISGLFAVTSLSVCTAWFHNTVTCAMQAVRTFLNEQLITRGGVSNISGT